MRKRVLYLECGMGAAGDMLTGALLEVCPEREGFLEVMNGLGLPGVAVAAEGAEKCGVRGTYVTVRIGGREEGEVAHEGHCGHTSQRDIRELINGLALPEKVRRDAMAVYGRIAEAEAEVHGCPVEQIHFHEVGALDAVADVVGVCYLMNELAPEEVVVSPVNVGFGRVRCSHGILPVPAPATARLLRGVPVYSGEVEGELCTPTGAALLSYFATRFGRMPSMELLGIGYGMGRKDFVQANCVRAFLGEENSVFAGSVGKREAGISGEAAGMDEEVPERDGETAVELVCNLDDMTGEMLGYAAEKLRAEGAMEVFLTPVQMKKNRPGQLLTCLCRKEDEGRMAALIFLHTTTLGVRRRECGRYVLERSVETVETVYGPVRVKRASGCGVVRSKPEYEDAAAAAQRCGVPVSAVLDSVAMGR